MSTSKIIIFPYFFIQEKVNIGNLEIKPGIDNYISLENQDIQTTLSILPKCFHEDNRKPIKFFSYVINNIVGKESQERHTNILKEFSMIMRFNLLSDHEPNNYYSHFDYYIFDNPVEQLKSNAEYKQISCSHNGETLKKFFLENQTIIQPYIPSQPHRPIMMLNIHDVEMFDAFYLFRDHFFKEKEAKRILKAIEWYTRSYHQPAGTDLCNSIINMESAFEALLKVEGTRFEINTYVKCGICNILGETEELKAWVDNFWKLRNAIVHGDIELPSFLYTPPGGTTGYLHHLYLARLIFKKCVESILKLRQTVYTADIHSTLVSNQIRMKKALRLLHKAKGNLNRAITNRALDVIEELREYDLSASIRESLHFGDIFYRLVLRTLDQTESQQQNLATLLTMVINRSKTDKKKFEKLESLYWEIHRISPWHFIDKTKPGNANLIKLGNALEAFNNYMYWRWLMYNQMEK